MGFLASDLIANSRDSYNGTDDTFFTDTYLYQWLTDGCNSIARRSFCIEATSTDVTVASQADYDYPDDCIAIKRITVDGKKVQLITKREYDVITLTGQTSDTTGQPVFYTDFNNVISFFPIPSTADLDIVFDYFSDQPSLIEGSTVLVPYQFQLGLVDYVLSKMYQKDKDFNSATYYDNRFEKTIREAIAYMQKKKRTDKFAQVQSEELLINTIYGAT